MNFQINSTHFSTKMEFSDEINIKSNKANYTVSYSNNTLEELLIQIYNENDFIFIDKNVYNLNAYIFSETKTNHYPPTKYLLFDATEENKNINSVLTLIDFLHKNNFNKKNKLIVIGGGITQDIGGFACGIYKRGINWVLIPTTLLSMTDSCIGSKVSANHTSKNILGMFIAPNRVYVSDYFLKTLPHNDIISGIGESIKLSLIGGKDAYEYIYDEFQKKNYMNIIKISLLIKKAIIETDEFDENERKVLNYGHSIGHALESTSHYFIPHGIAVLMGIYIKNRLFYGDKYQEINSFILEIIDRKYFKINIDYDTFIQHLQSDKKNIENKICIIKLEEIGKSICSYIYLTDIYEPLKNIFLELFVL